MLEEIAKFEKLVKAYHEEHEGHSFGHGSVTISYSDYTAELLDALGNLTGVIEMGAGER